MAQRRGAHDPLVERAARVVLRPIGNPLPLGFLALAGGTLTLAGLQLGWYSDADSRTVGLILVAFVFPLQLIASIFGYLARDVVAGTGMGILAGAWLAVGLVILTGEPGSTSDALGHFMLLAAVALLVPAAVASGGKLLVTAVITTTAVRFAATGIYEVTASGIAADIAGVIGLALCALAIYAALAMALEDARRQTVLPVLRRGWGRNALEADLATQVERIEHEAGVREQL